MSYTVSSAYDPAANLRLLRIAGDNIPDRILLGIGRADPTTHLIPTAKNLIDIRDWRYQGSVAEIKGQAELLSELFEDGMGEGYVWVTNPVIHGVTLVFRQHIVKAGVGNPVAVTLLEAALDRLGVSMADYLRAEKALTAITFDT